MFSDVSLENVDNPLSAEESNVWVCAECQREVRALSLSQVVLNDGGLILPSEKDEHGSGWLGSKGLPIRLNREFAERIVEDHEPINVRDHVIGSVQ
jgi:hypothetical protein